MENLQDWPQGMRAISPLCTDQVPTVPAPLQLPASVPPDGRTAVPVLPQMLALSSLAILEAVHLKRQSVRNLQI
jgi:hypothetical protein